MGHASDRSKWTMIFRPQPVGGHEAPWGIVRTMMGRAVVLAPIGRVSEVVAVAKARAAPKTVLDGEGGDTASGLIQQTGIATEEKRWPIGPRLEVEIVREISEGVWWITTGIRRNRAEWQHLESASHRRVQ